MIACRSFFRVDTALKSTRNFVISPSFRRLQRCYFRHAANYNLKIDIREALLDSMDRKKQKKVSCVWRKVSTLSNSHKEYEVKDVNMTSQSLDFGVKGENEGMGNPAVQVIDGTSLSQCEVEIQAEGETHGSHGPQLDCAEIGAVNEESATSAGNESVSVECSSSTKKHTLTVEVGASLIRFIKGKWGSTQKMIEEETGVKIIFPSSRKEDAIVIEGDSAESVTSGSVKIETIVNEAVNSSRLDYSHFVSLPLAVHPELVDKLVNFQNSILGASEVDQSFPDSGSESDASDVGNDVQHSDQAAKVAVELEAATEVAMESEAANEVEVKSETSTEVAVKSEAATEAAVRSEGTTETTLKSKAGKEVAVKSEEKASDKQFSIGGTSIPLVSYAPKNFKASATELKTSKISDLGIDSSIFIKPKTFHLTVLMLKLWNEERLEAAAKVLQCVSSKVVDALDGRPISIRLRGLECMRGSFAKARVLYAPIEEVGGEDRLMRVCQVIIDAFVEAGLVLEKDARQKLKLHATVMNVRHRKRNFRRRNNDFFDARKIAEQYGSVEWGEFVIPEAHLSEIFAFDENGYYHCCASIPFPKKMPQD